MACVDVDAAGLAETVEAIATAGGRAVPLAADVTDLAAVEAAVAAAVAELGGLDGVANVAGVGDFTGDVTEIALDEWARVLAINLTGAFHVSRATIPHLRAAGGGAIVNVARSSGSSGASRARRTARRRPASSASRGRWRSTTPWRGSA